MGQVKNAYQEDMESRFNGINAAYLAGLNAAVQAKLLTAPVTTPSIKIFLLMDCSQVVASYMDEALAHHDCLTCHEGMAYEPEPLHHDYWVKPLDLDTRVS